ncbi:MAG: GDP-mannose 4,6-dehydratase [Vicinamibacterales bacterium]
MSIPLVTGAAGFAGSHLVEHLLETEPAIAAWSNPGGQPAGTAEPRVRWRAVDLLDAAAVATAIAELRPSAIYHCAGFASVDAAWSSPARVLQVNALGTEHLLAAVRRATLSCRVLVTGSALVYQSSAEPLDEQAPLAPVGPYGLSKLAQEMLTLGAKDLSTILTRPFNHAGPRQGAEYVTSTFARQIVQIERGAQPPVMHVGNLDSRRDITDVRDVVRAYAMLVASGRTHRPYNICSGTAHRIGDVLDALIALAHVRVSIEPDPARMRPSDNPVVLGDRTRVLEDVGWAPRIAIEQTLSDLLDDCRQQPEPPRGA